MTSMKNTKRMHRLLRHFLHQNENHTWQVYEKKALSRTYP